MRGDIARLGRCTSICTQGEDTIKRSKPFKYAYEKEIVMYAYFKKLDYFSTECIYSPDAYRGHARVFLKDLEAARPSAIIDIIHSGEAFEITEEVKATQKVQRMSFPIKIFDRALLSTQRRVNAVVTCPVTSYARHVLFLKVWNEGWRPQES